MYTHVHTHMHTHVITETTETLASLHTQPGEVAFSRADGGPGPWAPRVGLEERRGDEGLVSTSPAAPWVRKLAAAGPHLLPVGRDHADVTRRHLAGDAPGQQAAVAHDLDGLGRVEPRRASPFPSFVALSLWGDRRVARPSQSHTAQETLVRGRQSRAGARNWQNEADETCHQYSGHCGDQGWSGGVVRVRSCRHQSRR